MLRPFYLWERHPVIMIQEAGLVPAPLWTGAKNFDPNDIRSPDCPSDNDTPSLPTYSHRGHTCWIETALETGYSYTAARQQGVTSEKVAIFTKFLFM